MAKKSTIIKNWPKYLLQWGVLLALIVFITGLIPSKEPADPEAYCPMGGLQALTTFLVKGSLPCSMSSLQIMMGIALAAAVVLFSKLFCGYICPLGTVQDLLAKLRKALHIKEICIKNGSVADSILRIFKYCLLFWIFYMTATASELFCKNLDPYYAVATGFKGEITLWMSIVTICLLILGGFFINMFWCKYLCPLGAISNSLKFWIWIIVLFVVYYLLGLTGLNIPWYIFLGAFCLLGYLLEIFCRNPKMQILHVVKDESACTHCGICTKKCPYHIDVDSLASGKVTSVDCTLCGECVAACPTETLHVGVCRNTKSNAWKVVPAILTVVLIAVGMYFGGRMELPTINVEWGIEQVAEDGTMTSLVDRASLATMEMTGLRSVKCYGSSMAFKAKLQKIPGIHGVKTFVNHHTATILYDPSVTSPEKIQESIFVPSKFKISTPDHTAVDSIKVVTIRTENMYDKMDINYLGLQMRLTGKKIYGVTSEFACPLIVKVYMDPSENLDENWFEKLVEKDKLVMPIHGGGTKEIDLDYTFVKMEDEVSYMSTEDYIKMMFSYYKSEKKSTVEKYAGKPQFIYEMVDANFEKPIVSRYMPYLSSHLKDHEGIIGVYLVPNKDLIASIQIRFADPMTADELWKLITSETWTISYSNGTVKEEPAKITFDAPGIVYEYEE